MKKIAMIAMFFGFVGAVHAGVSCDAEGCPPSASAEQPTMLAGSQLNQCKWQCDEYQDGSQACYETCEKHHGGQASIEQPTMFADTESIKLNTDPLCDTDPYSCFHLADHDATVVREDMQVAIPILIWIFNQL
ncbi:hypothetical protein [Thioalkalivibrio sp. HK1]|uniref:hypothetical protein n=1 Tax=Thioalkalivibrio sp. HK1 TaxID=1469245 RepID=UPI0012DF8CA1|nr:hypothetical protein [Thioalkalivibrio sp. HK1]